MNIVNLLLVGILLLVITYMTIIMSYKFFGKTGLFICIPLTIIIANIQVVMTVDMFGYVMTLGNIAYASSYLITDILGENHSFNDAKKGVYLGFFSMIMFVVIMNITLLFNPISSENFLESDIAFSNDVHNSLNLIFSFLPRVAIASVISYLVSQSLDVRIFSKIKKKTNGKALWLRNNLSTVTSQLIDTVLFTFLAFFGTMSLSVTLQILITTFVLKLIISLLDTPFMYLAKYMYKTNKINEN